MFRKAIVGVSVLAAAALVASVLVVGGCSQPPAGPTVVPGAAEKPAVTEPGRREQSVPPGVTTPIRTNKPRTLGPVEPAIVLLPRSVPEPMVRVRITAERAAPPAVDAARFRGRVETVKLADGNYVALNVLPMDEYLAGVLAKELYPSWDAKAYEAQAIAARTYALYQLWTEGQGKAWDVSCDESSQMYGGRAGESSKARAAVEATRGQVLTTRDRNGARGIFCAFYSACSGGATQSPFDAWGDLPATVLQARVTGNVDAACPKFRWGPLAISKRDVTRVIAAWAQRNVIPELAAVGNVADVAVVARNEVTGRPTYVRVTGVNGKSGLMRAEEFRLALLNDPAGTAPKPPSSFCDISARGDAIVLSDGRGYGHGIGMSQWGAEALAKEGHEAGEILGFYYPGAEVVRLW